MWHHKSYAMKSGLMAESLVALVMELEVIRLESSLTSESDNKWACTLPSLSFPSLPDVYATCPPLKEGSYLFLLRHTSGLVLSVILHLYAARCPAYCSLLCLSCPLATSWLDASCVKVYEHLFTLLVVTLLRHVCKTLMHCLWLCYYNSTKYLHAAIAYSL